MRLLLFTGKGGVGTTTVAASTAVHAARCGVKTLLVCTGDTHALADTLATPLGPRAVEVEPGLSAAQSRSPRQGRSAGRSGRVGDRRPERTAQDYLLGLSQALGVDPPDPDDLDDLLDNVPGAQQLLGLLAIRDAMVCGLWDLVVVDCPPTPQTVRLLALPEAVAHCLARALPVERRVLRALAAGRAGPSSARTSGRGRRTDSPPVPPRDPVVEAAERLHTELGEVRGLLTAATSSVRLVLTPERVVVAEARRAWTSLALYGHTVDGVVANRLMPSDPTGVDAGVATGGDAGGADRDAGDPWRAGWAQAQARCLADVEASFAPIPVLRAGYAPGEPVGPDALAALGAELYGPVSPASVQALLDPPVTAGPFEVRRDGHQFVLRLRLPLAQRTDVDLSRDGDDLLLAVGGHRRVIALPSALRRCVVVGARLRDGVLDVRFEPDPDLWRPV